MTRRIISALAICLFIAPAIYADEGMWLLKYLKQQNHKKMQALGLQLRAEEIYNEKGIPSLTDAVVLFDGGCTGEVVSDQGLVFTNHHCGYDAIQNHSSVEHNYLRDGFIAPTFKDELPNPGLTVIFTERIEDVTTYVNDYIQKSGESDPMVYLTQKFLLNIANKWYDDHNKKRIEGLVLELKPFFEGNKYYLYIKKEYRDVRLVAAPPSSIGKFGADSDNWIWPRHTGDFSVFRIYTAPDGSPAEYAPENIPLRPKKHLLVSTKGVNRDDFVMIMGHPGTTNHFFTAPEVKMFRDVDNSIRIKMRTILQNEMQAEMRADDAVNIQYAAKYAYSANGHKRAIGSNWAIDKKRVISQKEQQMEKLRSWALKNKKPQYIEAMETITDLVTRITPLRTTAKLLEEALIRGCELIKLPLLKETEFTTLKNSPEELEKWLSTKYDTCFNKDYNPKVAKRVTKALLEEFQTQDKQTNTLKGIENIEAYTEQLFDQSCYRSRDAFQKMILSQSYQVYLQDPAVALTNAVQTANKETKQTLAPFETKLRTARHTYVAGIMEMEGAENLWPDANLTLRYTFGTVKGYAPRDNVFYGHQTTIDGVLEKVVPGDYEFDLQEHILSLFQSKDFGQYAQEDGRMPVNFCATTHTTGGNSGSPVLNANGHLVGLNFDRNWEGVGGDINYLPDYQRSIICDVRYLLLVLDKVLHADRIINELDLVSK